MSTDARWIESMPDVYDRCLGPALFAPFAAVVAAEAQARDPRRVLELAAGTGILTRELVRALPSAEVTGTDLSPAMVGWAAERIVGPRWLQADAQHLDLPDAGFDLVACQFGVMFFPDKPAAFAEAARVLAPGGTMLFTVWDAVETSDFPAAMMQSLTAVLGADVPDFIVRIPHGYYDSGRLTTDLAAGGLVAEGIERIVLRGRSPSVQTITEGFCLGTPLRFTLQERGSLETLTTALQGEMIARLGTGPVEGELAAFLVTASKAA